MDRPSAWTYSSIHPISPAVCIAKRISDMVEPCGTAASTGWLSHKLPLITISPVLSERKILAHRIRSPSILWAFIAWISVPLATVGNAAFMSIRMTPVMLSTFYAVCAVSTMMAVAMIADLFFMLPN